MRGLPRQFLTVALIALLALPAAADAKKPKRHPVSVDAEFSFTGLTEYKLDSSGTSLTCPDNPNPYKFEDHVRAHRVGHGLARRGHAPWKAPEEGDPVGRAAPRRVHVVDQRRGNWPWPFFLPCSWLSSGLVWHYAGHVVGRGNRPLGFSKKPVPSVGG